MHDIKESFKILKEISSHYKKINDLDATIFNENERITTLVKQKNTRIEINNENKKELQRLQEQLDELSQKIEDLFTRKNQVEFNLKSVTTEKELIGLEAELKILISNINNNEQKSFELLNRIEELTEQDKTDNVFFQGLDNTLSDIKQEVNEVISKHKHDIDILTNRILLLKEELPSVFVQKLDGALKKKLPHGPFTKISGQYCMMCKMKFSSVMLAQVEETLTLSTCPGCYRIILPEAASY